MILGVSIIMYGERQREQEHPPHDHVEIATTDDDEGDEDEETAIEFTKRGMEKR